MRQQSSTGEASAQVKPRWDRMRSVTLLAAFEELAAGGMSEREFAQAAGVPQTTLQHWRARKAELDSEPVLVAFFESSTGLAFLHRLIGAVHFVFGQIEPCGVDMICTFLELARLDAFVATSHGAQHGVATDMTEEIVSFGRTQRALQARVMPQRTIALAEDETFPQGVWLVAMDPVSGFIVLEEEAENREAATWTARLEAATADLWVTVAVAGGDEASGLAAHATQIGAHHAPDLFHVQHPLWRAVVQPLQRSLERPAAALARATQVATHWRNHLQANIEGPRPPGRPLDYQRRIVDAEVAEVAARTNHEAAVGRKDAVYAAIRRLGSAYHPVDPTTGAPRTTEQVAGDLNAAITTLRETAMAIDLSEKRRGLIEKAARVIPKMVATVEFYYAELGRQLDTLALPVAVRQYVEPVLVPAAYMARLTERATSVAERTALLAVRQRLLDRAEPTVLLLITPGQWRIVDRVVLTCVDLFVRSTSCVEGRNGRLALWHHHKHRLSAIRLSALTVIHNYWLRRANGTTAAERFFEVPHSDLFEWLLDHMDLPARPAAPPAQARAA